MAVRFLCSALTGTSVSMALAGQSTVNIPTWGDAGTGGTVTIDVDRSFLKCNPDSVRFSINLSAATFDTAGPSGGDPYDARLHDIEVYWDFDDDAGDWTAPVNVLAAWKNRSIGKGHWASHVYTLPRPAALGAGNGYNVTAFLYEKSSGKTATAAVEVFVEDADVVYAGAKTVVVNPVGITDWTGEPTGATRMNANGFDVHPSTTDANWESIRTGPRGEIRRILFREGHSFDVRIQLDETDSPHLCFGTYGSGAKPVINSRALGDLPDKSCFYFPGQHSFQDYPSGPTVDMRFSGLDFQGTFDPQVDSTADPSGVGTSGRAISGWAAADLVVSDCDFAGFKTVTLDMYPGEPEPGVHVPTWLHMDNCTFSEFGGQYPVNPNRIRTSTGAFSATGCRMAQNPMALDANGGGTSGSRACIRHEQIPFTYIAGCDFYHTDHNQHCIKLLTVPQDEGAIANVHWCSFEGGAGAVVVTGNTTDPTGLDRNNTQNVIIDGIVFVGNYASEAAVRTFSSGTTVRNSLAVFPNAIRLPGAPVVQGFINVESHGTGWPAYVNATPLNVYNNTLLIDRTKANNADVIPKFVFDVALDPGDFPNLNVENNVFHMPNMDGDSVTTFAPLSSVELWTARSIGRRDGDTGVWDASYAVPAGSVKDTKPQATSAALGAATTGNVAYKDLGETIRPDPANKGAWAGTAA